MSIKLPTYKILLNEKVVLGFILSFGIISVCFYPESFIWDDSYFYLVIARNIILKGSQTFSGIFPTNGFHPLWLYLLTAYSYVIAIFNANLLFKIQYALPFAFIFVVWGAFNFWKVSNILNLSKIAFVGIPLCYLLFFQVLYSEAYLYYTALSLLTLISVNSANNVIAKPFNPYLAGFMCGLVFLSRLDSVFIISCYFLWCFNITKNNSSLIRLTITFFITIAPYLASNIFSLADFYQLVAG